MKNLLKEKNIKTNCHCEGFSPWQSNEIASHSFAMTGCGESGRSMVEMLGVLAVIGVLSVAGIAGYTTAMNQYRANEAINRAMRVAVMASSQRLLNPSAVLTDLEDDVAMGNDADKIVLTLSNIPDKVRSRIEAMNLKNSKVTQGENGALVFTFNNDLSERSSGTSGGNSGQGQEPATPVDPCNGHGSYNGTTCTCTDNYYGDTCENAPLTCEHGSWDTTNHFCDCDRTGYDGDRCQNEVVVTAENFSTACSASIRDKNYCYPDGIFCMVNSCMYDGDEEYFWDTTQEPTCSDPMIAEHCDWIGEEPIE